MKVCSLSQFIVLLLFSDTAGHLVDYSVLHDSMLAVQVWGLISSKDMIQG